jgi:hypothetical protein
VLWSIGSVAALGLGVFTVWLGNAVLPPRERAEDVDTIVPWFLTWGLVWLTTGLSILIAVNLVRLARPANE